MVTWQLPPDLALVIAQLAGALHARLAGRLLPLCTGLLFARGRRTVTSWLRAAGVGADYKAYYYFLASLGRKARWVGARLLGHLRRTVPFGERVLLALDDTPTQR